MLCGAPGTFSSSQCPVQPTSRAPRGRFKGSGGGSTTGERSQVRGQKSIPAAAPLPSPPIPSPSPSLSVSSILKPRQLPRSPETQRNHGVGPAPRWAEIEGFFPRHAPSLHHSPPGAWASSTPKPSTEQGKAGRKSLRLAALVTACPAPLRHRREPARSSPRGGAGDRGPGRRPLR